MPKLPTGCKAKGSFAYLLQAACTVSLAKGSTHLVAGSAYDIRLTIERPCLKKGRHAFHSAIRRTPCVDGSRRQQEAESVRISRDS